MADRATADRVSADMKPPNYRGAVQRLRTIKAKKDRISGINGEIGGIYDAVEGFKVNKKASRIFLTLDGLEHDERQDIWRSLVGLIDSAGWVGGDLVDAAEGGKGNIVAPDFTRGKGAPKKGETNAAGEDVEIDEAMREVEGMGGEKVEEISDEERAKREAEFEAAAPAASTTADAVKPESPAQKRERAKKAFAAGKAPDAAAETEPYTGDNSDLAD